MHSGVVSETREWDSFPVESDLDTLISKTGGNVPRPFSHKVHSVAVQTLHSEANEIRTKLNGG